MITNQQAFQVTEEFGTPTFVYSEEQLRNRVQDTLAFPHAFGLTIRYAMKALPTRAILQLFAGEGLHFDASSVNEVRRALAAGINPKRIQLTTQLPPTISELQELLDLRVSLNACSLLQLGMIGTVKPGAEVSLRINPGMGSGWVRQTNTGGEKSSFGIWHEDIPQAISIAEKYGLRITALHTHIGSGSNPAVWQDAAQVSLQFAEVFTEVHTLNLGGGFKVARMPGETATNLQECGEPIRCEFEAFYRRTGRRLHLEIEPGTYLVANAGSIIARVCDLKSTTHHDFIITDTGMTEILRPMLYGAQHPLEIVQRDPSSEEERYTVVGKCCESGDTITRDITLPRVREGDLLVIGGAGAYCSGMDGSGYNSYTQAAEVLIREEGTIQLIRQREELREVTRNELDLKISIPVNA